VTPSSGSDATEQELNVDRRSDTEGARAVDVKMSGRIANAQARTCCAEEPSLEVLGAPPPNHLRKEVIQ
jgi:hypothetical protein